MVVAIDACTSLKSTYQIDHIDYHDEVAPIAIAKGYRLGSYIFDAVVYFF
jgi:hypothetical protein